MQIMVRLINKFNSSSSSLEEKIAALFDLEYYVHQVLHFLVFKCDFSTASSKNKPSCPKPYENRQYLYLSPRVYSIFNPVH